MKLRTNHLKILQEFLRERNKYKGEIDGIAGNGTLKAAKSIVRDIEPNMPDERIIPACIQHLCILRGINPGPIDGWIGEQTMCALDDLLHLEKHGVFPEPWRDALEEHTWPTQDVVSLKAFYGREGTKQTFVDTPYTLIIAWNTSQTTNRIRCHEKVAPSLSRVLKAVHKEYGDKEIGRLKLNHYGGCLVKPGRYMRGGSRASTHNWGIAIDWHPAMNRLRWKDRKVGKAPAAVFSKPEYEAWWDCWEREGWVSLGRAKNYDWMHVQAARV